MILNRVLSHLGLQLVRANERLFRGGAYQRINHRRLEHLASLGLPIAGKRALEIGAGIGDLSHFFIDRQCELTITDGREENAAFIRSRYPDARVQRLDLDHPQAVAGSPFEIVFAYGLLYHLSRPAEAIAWMAANCSGFTLIETCVSFGDESAELSTAEAGAMATESIHGRGCRPTRSWVWEELRKNFAHVHVPATQPSHREFPRRWRQADGASAPWSGSAARAIFIGSHVSLGNPRLLDHLPDEQAAEIGG